jgi:hypothetical protein
LPGVLSGAVMSAIARNGREALDAMRDSPCPIVIMFDRGAACQRAAKRYISKKAWRRGAVVCLVFTYKSKH